MISSCIYFYRWHFHSFLTFKNLLYFYLFVCVCKLEDNLWKSVLFFYHMGPGYGLRPSGLVTISLGWAISTLTAQFHSSLCSFVERYTCHGAIACWRRTRSACCRIFGISYQGKRMALGERSSLCSDFVILSTLALGTLLNLFWGMDILLRSPVEISAMIPWSCWTTVGVGKGFSQSMGLHCD